LATLPNPKLNKIWSVPLRRATFKVKSYLLCGSKTWYIWFNIDWKRHNTGSVLQGLSSFVTNSSVSDEGFAEEWVLSDNWQLLFFSPIGRHTHWK
jgi:hypothetical protein